MSNQRESIWTYHSKEHRRLDESEIEGSHRPPFRPGRNWDAWFNSGDTNGTEDEKDGAPDTQRPTETDMFEEISQEEGEYGAAETRAAQDDRASEGSSLD